MEIISFSLSFSVLILSLAILSNRSRASRTIEFKLEPNCLLTRWPILFITGHRSIFYFSSYWNIYTSFLAEHGYEVYTLHLPWNNNRLRRERFKLFLDEQEKQQRIFHIVVDMATFEELKDIIFDRKSVIVSLTELRDENFPDNNQSLYPFPIIKNSFACKSAQNPSLLQTLCHKLHRQLTKQNPLPSLDTLGGNPKTAISNSLRLLEHMKTLAEMDLMNG